MKALLILATLMGSQAFADTNTLAEDIHREITEGKIIAAMEQQEEAAAERDITTGKILAAQAIMIEDLRYEIEVKILALDVAIGMITDSQTQEELANEVNEVINDLNLIPDANLDEVVGGLQDVLLRLTNTMAKTKEIVLNQ